LYHQKFGGSNTLKHAWYVWLLCHITKRNQQYVAIIILLTHLSRFTNTKQLGTYSFKLSS
jgi:hypothetical protein